jgi:cytochrome P450 family 4
MTSPEHKENHTISIRLILSTLVLIFFLTYNWSRRWLYYYGSKIKGPFAWPIIGSTYLFIGGYKDSYKILTNLIDSQPPIFKLWMGIKLVILTTQPTHAEVILKTCFNRLGTIKHMEELFQTGLFTSPADIWRTRRRIINKSFNTNILNAYVDIFDKRARHLMQHFEEKCDGNYIDVLEAFISCSLGTACETLFDVDSNLITGQDRYIANVSRMAEILLIRASNIWLHPNFIWKYSSLRKELTTINRENFNFLRQIIQMKKMDSAFFKNTYSSGGKEKLFLNNLLNLESESEKLSETDVVDEMHTILCAASETIAITVGLLLSMMGLYPTIQKTIQEELDSIFGSSERNVTVEDVNKMYCLERVIKETMRLFPAVPFIKRAVDKDIQLGRNI